MVDKLLARRSIRAIPAIGLALALAGCGGRVADPRPTVSAFDLRLSCAHLAAETGANLRRIEDLGDERNVNRVRNLTRIPGAILGNPLSAFALADTSRAIYLEIDALEARNERLVALTTEKRCGEEPPPAPPVLNTADAADAAPSENAAGGTEAEQGAAEAPPAEQGADNAAGQSSSGGAASGDGGGAAPDAPESGAQ